VVIDQAECHAPAPHDDGTTALTIDTAGLLRALRAVQAASAPVAAVLVTSVAAALHPCVRAACAADLLLDQPSAPQRRALLAAAAACLPPDIETATRTAVDTASGASAAAVRAALARTVACADSGEGRMAAAMTGALRALAVGGVGRSEGGTTIDADVTGPRLSDVGGLADVKVRV
jgi:hypothetical protein